MATVVDPDDSDDAPSVESCTTWEREWGMAMPLQLTKHVLTKKCWDALAESRKRQPQP